MQAAGTSGCDGSPTTWLADRGPPSPICRYDAETLSLQSSQGKGFRAELRSRRVGGRHEFDMLVPQHVLGVCLNGHTLGAEAHFDSGPIQRFVLRPGQVQLFPARHRFRGHTEGVGSCRILTVFLDPQLIASASGGQLDPSAVEVIPSLDLGNPGILRSMVALARELEQPGPMGGIYAESLALVILTEVVRQHADCRPALRIAAHLSSRRLRRATDYIEAHLDEDLSLLTLATEAGLSAVHFAREFKRLTGSAPHRYVLGRRLERARTQLARGDRSITEVALTVGFSSQSHLTTAFRRVYGTTPAAYRNERKVLQRAGAAAISS
jgi:AraC family transcriptional regulator